MNLDLFPKFVSPLRRRLRTVAFLAFLAFCVAIIVSWLAGARAPFALFLRLPLAAAIPFQAASSGSSAIIIAELLTGMIPSGTSWSDRAYFRIVILLWIVLSAISVTGFVLGKDRLTAVLTVGP